MSMELEKLSFDEKITESKRMREKYPDRVPVIVQRAKKSK